MMFVDGRTSVWICKGLGLRLSFSAWGVGSVGVDENTSTDRGGRFQRNQTMRVRDRERKKEFSPCGDPSAFFQGVVQGSFAESLPD